MKDISEMTYEEWLEYKEEEDKKITRYSEIISKDEPLYIHVGVVDICFSEDRPLMQFTPVYWMSEQMESEQPDCDGIAGYGRILFNKDRWDALDLGRKYH